MNDIKRMEETNAWMHFINDEVDFVFFRLTRATLIFMLKAKRCALLLDFSIQLIKETIYPLIK